MGRSDKFRGYGWIKGVRRYRQDPTLPEAEQRDRQAEHHFEEVAFLDAELQKLLCELHSRRRPEETFQQAHDRFDEFHIAVTSSLIDRIRDTAAELDRLDDEESDAS